MWQFVWSALRAGIRSHSIHAVFVVGLLLIGVSYLAGYFSPRQPQTVALDVGFSGIRIALVLLALFWIMDLVGKEIDRKTVLFSLSYPMPRSAYLLGRYVGILILLALAALIMGLLLWLSTMLAGAGYEQEKRVALGLPFWVTIFGTWLNAAVVVAFSLCITSLSTVAVLPLALGVAFAVSGQAMGAVMDYLGSGADGDLQMAGRYGPVVNAIQWVIPDLSRLDWRSWSLYGLIPEASSWGTACLMAVAYIGVMLALAIFSFNRRELF